jgi:ATP-dependent DNA ligase
MTLPLKPPIKPQLAKPKDELPEGEGWCYEPKLDGFRTIVFVDGDSHLLQSRNGKPMDRYFPELRFPPGRYVLDGELIISDGEAEDFEALQNRIHPAASRRRASSHSTCSRTRTPSPSTSRWPRGGRCWSRWWPTR